MYDGLLQFTSTKQWLIIKDFLTYSFGSLFLRGISILLLPITMRMLSPEEYGTVSLVNAFIAIGSAILGIGLRQMLSLEYFHHDAHEKKQLIINISALYTYIALPAISLIWLLRAYCIEYIFLNTISSQTFALILISLFFFFYVELMYQIMQYQRAALQLTKIQIAIAMSIAACTIFFVWHIHMKQTGIIAAQCIGTCIGIAFATYYFTSHGYTSYAPRLNQNIVITYLKRALPFIPTILFNWILASGDRWMLAYYDSMHSVGIYAIADLFAQLFYTLILQPWAGSYLPYIMQTYKDNTDNLAPIEAHNKKTMFLAMGAAAGLITIGTLSCQSLFKFLLPLKFHAALHYIWLLLMGQVFLLGSYFASALIQFHKKTYFLAGAIAIPAAINLMLNALLIPYWGILGCSVATLISYIVYFGITLLYNKKITNSTCKYSQN